MKSIPKDELERLARNHHVACENIALLTRTLKTPRSPRDKLTMLHLLMLMRYAAIRSDYLLQCYAARTDPTPVSLNNAPLPVAFSRSTVPPLEPPEPPSDLCQCHLISVNVECQMPPCTCPLAKDPMARSRTRHEGHNVTEACFQRSQRLTNFLQWGDVPDNPAEAKLFREIQSNLQQ